MALHMAPNTRTHTHILTLNRRPLQGATRRDCCCCCRCHSPNSLFGTVCSWSLFSAIVQSITESIYRMLRTGGALRPPERLISGGLGEERERQARQEESGERRSTSSSKAQLYCWFLTVELVSSARQRRHFMQCHWPPFP